MEPTKSIEVALMRELAIECKVRRMNSGQLRTYAATLSRKIKHDFRETLDLLCTCVGREKLPVIGLENFAFKVVREVNSQYPDAKFLIVLDACRHGSAEITNESPPQNVIVVYSCAAGEHALENDVSSSYVESFLKCIPRCLKRHINSHQYCNLNDLIRAQSEEIRDISGGLITSLECHGINQDQVWIPVVEQAASVDRIFPTIEVKTRAISSRLARVVLEKLKRCFSQIAPDCRDINQFIRKSYTESRDFVTIQVILPTPNVLYSPQSALNFVLSTCPGIFEDIILVWPKVVNEDWIRRIARTGQFAYRSLPQNQFLFTWSDGDYEGQGHIRITSKNQTVLEIVCQPREQRYKYYLEYLPSLGKIYDAFISSMPLS